MGDECDGETSCLRPPDNQAKYKALLNASALLRCSFQKSRRKHGDIWIIGVQRANQFFTGVFQTELSPHYPAQKDIVCFHRHLSLGRLCWELSTFNSTLTVR